MTTTAFNTEIGGVENKIQNIGSLVKTTFVDTTIGEVESTITNHAKYITTL